MDVDYSPHGILDKLKHHVMQMRRNVPKVKERLTWKINKILHEFRIRSNQFHLGCAEWPIRFLKQQFGIIHSLLDYLFCIGFGIDNSHVISSLSSLQGNMLPN